MFDTRHIFKEAYTRYSSKGFSIVNGHSMPSLNGIIYLLKIK